MTSPVSLEEHIDVMYNVVQGRGLPGVYKGEIPNRITGFVRHVVEIQSTDIAECLKRIKGDANKRGVWSGITDPDMDNVRNKYPEIWNTCVWCLLDSEEDDLDLESGSSCMVTLNRFELFPVAKLDWDLGVNIYAMISQ